MTMRRRRRTKHLHDYVIIFLYILDYNSPKNSFLSLEPETT